MGEELTNLLEAGFIRELKHPDRLVNLMMVSKKDKSQHLYVDFQNVSKVCPKDTFGCHTSKERPARRPIPPGYMLNVSLGQNGRIQLRGNCVRYFL